MKKSQVHTICLQKHILKTRVRSQVEGNIFAVYNMGTNDHPIGEISVKVNDNQYHVIRFTRSGANSTLQIDDYNLQSNHPQGKFEAPLTIT